MRNSRCYFLQGNTEARPLLHPVWQPSAQQGCWKDFKGTVSEPCWFHVLPSSFVNVLTTPAGETAEAGLNCSFTSTILKRQCWVDISIALNQIPCVSSLPELIHMERHLTIMFALLENMFTNLMSLLAFQHTFLSYLCFWVRCCYCSMKQLLFYIAWAFWL